MKVQCPLDGKVKRLRQCEKRGCPLLKKGETIDGGGPEGIFRYCDWG